MTFFEFLAEEVREYLAALGFRSLEEAIGHVELIDARKAVEHWKADGLDLAPILHRPDLPAGTPLSRKVGQDHGLEKALDHALVSMSGDALEHGAPVRGAIADPQHQPHGRHDPRPRGHAPVRRRRAGPGTIDFTLTGSAGQSFGAFVPRGITLRLVGDANDYVGKGLCGGRLVVTPDPSAPLRRRVERGRGQRHRATARRRARSTCAAWSASGSASATRARPRSSRASATTAAST